MFWKWQHFGEEHATDDDDDSGDGENAVLDLVLDVLIVGLVLFPVFSCVLCSAISKLSKGV